MVDILKNMRYDIPASIVVFFVAVPLCLGIALASGAPLFSGIIAGIVGGIVVGMLSGSALGVSGPAAGLAVIVLNSLNELGSSWETFLLAVMIAGFLQLIAGYLGGGAIGYYFPSSVIKGMLTGIGLIIILNQVPHALGYGSTASEPNLFDEFSHQHFLSKLENSLNLINPGALIITLCSLFILIIWEQFLLKKYKIFGLLQGPLMVVVLGIFLNYCYQTGLLPFSLDPKQVVDIPVTTGPISFIKQFTFPDFSQFTNYNVYKLAFTIAIIASLETLLSVEAIDKLDPYKRVTPTNRELKAQGVGNIVSGLIGGLPITQVIVRSSANLTFGARTKMSAVYHGVFLLLCTMTITPVLNMIPLAALASILLIVGYKLAKPSLFTQMYKAGWEQFLPFIGTIIFIIAYDLLIGVAAGMMISIFFIVKNNYKNSHQVAISESQNGHTYYINLAEEVSFLNKNRIHNELSAIPAQSNVFIDVSRCKVLDKDVIEIIHHFVLNAKEKNIKVELKGLSDVVTN